MKPASLISGPGLQDLVGLASSAPEGSFVEVGVYNGGSAWYLQEICKKRDCELHLFDTFTGMPKPLEIDGVKEGKFATGSFKAFCDTFDYSRIHRGLFPETLPDDLDDIAFVHADCDLYQSMYDIVTLLPERMVEGGIIFFHDYNFPGVKKAVDEVLSDLEFMTSRAIWRKKWQ